MPHDMLESDRRCDDHVLARCAAGSLSAAEEPSVIAHLDGCPRCRTVLEGLVASPAEMAELRAILGEGEGTDDDSDDGSGGEAVSRAGLVRSVAAFLRPSDDDAMLGRLGPYEIAGVIGSGGMGVVLKGWDRALDRFVAIKVLAPHLATSGAARKRFLREARAAAAVVHDNVIAIHGVAETDGIPYLVMPYCRGTTLEKRLRESGALETREILRIGMQTARGLAAAHGQGLVHRDVKPANILLDDGVERVLLTDFGLARAADDASLTRTGTLAGTPHYMSPEQATGGQVDQRSDLFALGGVMHAMATGQAPFRAESCHAVLRLVAESRAPDVRASNPDVPPWLAGVIAKLLSKEPVDRFQSAGELATLLEAGLAHVNDPLGLPLPDSVRTPPTEISSTGTSSPLLHRILETMSDQRFLARVSVGLFLAALLVPWLIAALGRDVPAIAFGIVAGLLAIAFAWLGREEPLARTTLKLSGVTLVLAAAVAASFVYELQIASQVASRQSAERIANEKAVLEDRKLALGRELRIARTMGQATIEAPSSGGVAGGFGTVGGMGAPGSQPPDARYPVELYADQGASAASLPDESTPDTAVPPAEGASPLGDLEGVWELLRPVGRDPAEQPLRIVFSPGLYADFAGETYLSSSSLTVDPHASPKRLSIKDEKGRPIHGIYDVQGDGLRLSIAPASEPWPSRFGTEHPEFARVTGLDPRELIGKMRGVVVRGSMSSEPSGTTEGNRRNAVETRTDEAAIQGTWRVHSTNEVPRETLETSPLRFRFKGDSLIGEGGNRGVMRYTFRLDSTATPKHFDLMDGDKVYAGIYSLDDGELWILIDDKTRPRGFNEEGKERHLFVLRRESAANQGAEPNGTSVSSLDAAGTDSPPSGQREVAKPVAVPESLESADSFDLPSSPSKLPDAEEETSSEVPRY